MGLGRLGLTDFDWLGLSFDSNFLLSSISPLIFWIVPVERNPSYPHQGHLKNLWPSRHKTPPWQAIFPQAHFTHPPSPQCGQFVPPQFSILFMSMTTDFGVDEVPEPDCAVVLSLPTLLILNKLVSFSFSRKTAHLFPVLEHLKSIFTDSTCGFGFATAFFSASAFFSPVFLAHSRACLLLSSISSMVNTNSDSFIFYKI